MLKSGVLNLTLKFPSPNRSPTDALLVEEAGGATLAIGAGATTGAATRTTWGAATGTLTRVIPRPVEVRPVEIRDPELLELALLEAPETAALTVCETRGEIWETIWATMSD
jgi:hypothetical protein